MERSWLPLLSLLGLFGTLLMLSPELLMGIATRSCSVPIIDPRVRRALAYGLLQYNKRMVQKENLFKVLGSPKVELKGKTRDEYHFTVRLMETTCKKTAPDEMDYKKIQRCPLLPGIVKIYTCYFKVVPNCEENTAVTSCT